LALHGDGAGWAPDVVHAHDWHTALLLALLSLHAEPHPPSVLTIHNLSYQGNFPIQTAAEARLRAELLRNNIAESMVRFRSLRPASALPIG
jgi:glycogen synthase